MTTRSLRVIVFKKTNKGLSDVPKWQEYSRDRLE